MKLQTFSTFLTKLEAEVSKGFVAVGIHPSSEVDLVDIPGRGRLGVGALVALAPGQATPIRAVRRPTGALTFAGVGNRASRDGIEFPGEQLVLQLYESCDVLVAPGPRLPVYRAVSIPTSETAVLPAAALLAFRLPFQGRKHAAISFYTDDDTDLSMTIVGHRLGYADKPLLPLYTQDPSSPYTFTGSTGTEVLDVAGIYNAKTIHIGGDADDEESFDELSVWVHDGDAGGTGSAVIVGEVDGERG